MDHSPTFHTLHMKMILALMFFYILKNCFFSVLLLIFHHFSFCHQFIQETINRTDVDRYPLLFKYASISAILIVCSFSAFKYSKINVRFFVLYSRFFIIILFLDHFYLLFPSSMYYTQIICKCQMEMLAFLSKKEDGSSYL